jgi:hypothetical protein
MLAKVGMLTLGHAIYSTAPMSLLRQSKTNSSVAAKAETGVTASIPAVRVKEQMRALFPP